MTDDLAGWVEQLRARYGTMREIAALIGMSESGFTRGVKRGTLSVENLLDLARATEEHPSTILRLADKAPVAALIEKLYGPGRDALKESQRKIVELWDRIDDTKAREAVLVTMTRFASAFGQPDEGSGGRGAAHAAKARSTRTARAGRKASKD